MAKKKKSTRGKTYMTTLQPDQAFSIDDIERNKALLEYYLEAGASLEEVAGIFKCSKELIEKSVRDIYNVEFPVLQEWCASSLKAKLRAIEFEHAKQNGAVAMFLGKNILKQSDDPTKLPNPDKKVFVYHIDDEDKKP
jgi:hypothetical protein